MYYVRQFFSTSDSISTYYGMILHLWLKLGNCLLVLSWKHYLHVNTILPQHPPLNSGKNPTKKLISVVKMYLYYNIWMSEFVSYIQMSTIFLSLCPLLKINVYNYFVRVSPFENKCLQFFVRVSTFENKCLQCFC